MAAVSVARYGSLVRATAPQVFAAAALLHRCPLLPAPPRRAPAFDLRRGYAIHASATSFRSFSVASSRPPAIVHCTLREGCDDWTLEDDGNVAINGSAFASQTSEEHSETGVLTWTLLVSKTPYTEVGVATDDGDRLTMVRPMPERELYVRTVCDFDAGRIAVFEGDSLESLAPVTWPVGTRGIVDIKGRSPIRLSINGFHEMRVQLLHTPPETTPSLPLVTSLPVDAMDVLGLSGAGAAIDATVYQQMRRDIINGIGDVVNPTPSPAACAPPTPPVSDSSSTSPSPSTSLARDLPSVAEAALDFALAGGEHYKFALALGQARGERDSALRELEHVRRERDEVVRRYQKLRWEVEDAARQVDAAKEQLEAAAKRLHRSQA